MRDSARQQLVLRRRASASLPRPRHVRGLRRVPWTMADEMRMPRKVNGDWEPFNPSDRRAYAPRQRLFRTPNDAFMTGHFHVSQSLLQNVLKTQTFSWVQLLLASIYSGAFHPTAEGQAAIADAVVEQARGVLAKYEGRARAAKRATLLRDSVGSRQGRAARSSPAKARHALRGARIRANALQAADVLTPVHRRPCTTARSVPATAAPTR